MTIQVIRNGKYDITAFVKSVTLSGDTTQFHRTLLLDMIASEYGRKRDVKAEEGDTITFKYDGVTRFIGVLFSQDVSSDNALTITCYDSNYYLLESTDSRIFINRKASDIIRMLAKDAGISIGNIADTGYVIPYLKLTNLSFYDMILKAITITFKQSGKRYFIGNVDGKLTLTRGTSTTRYLFKDGENLISASYSRSIEDTKTQAKVIGGPKGKETVVVVKDDAKRKKYGVLQAFEDMDEKASASQVKQRAQELLKEQSQVTEQFNVEALGVIEVDIGTPVYIANQLTSVVGAFYVTTLTHNFADSLHTMSFKITRTYELPDITISGDEVTKK